MKSNWKIQKLNLKKKYKYALIGMLSMLLFAIPCQFIDFTDHKYNPNKINENITEDSLIYTEPLSSKPDFTEANKTITKGAQLNPPFNETNIKFDDDIYDSTNFTLGSTFTKSYYDAKACLNAFGEWGTTAGGLNDHAGIASALSNLDGNQFYLFSYYIWHYPLYFPIISFACGGFSSINNPDINPHIYRIRIEYTTQTAFATFTGRSINLLMSVYTNTGLEKWFTIDLDPGQFEINSGVFTILDEDFVNMARNGGFINKIAFWMDCRSEISNWAYVGVDYIRIHYDYHTYDVDFTYKLNYDTHILSSVEEFEVMLKVIGTVNKPTWCTVYLHNFNTTEWDSIGDIKSAGYWNKIINVNASVYFNNDNDLLIRFKKYKYTEATPPSSYHIDVDLVEIKFNVPDPPSNFYAKSGIAHIMLTWNVPNSYGILIDHYNIYRGEIGLEKKILATSSINEFNDTSAEIGIQYYYVVSAENSIGESLNSSERTAMAYNVSFVEWKSPTENEWVIFGTGLAYFNFTFDRARIDDATLEINGKNYGSVINRSYVIIFPYNDTTDGKVNATIHGYLDEVEITNDTIHCFFSKLTSDEYELLKEDRQYIGQKLYLIMHDPSGDDSHSFYEHETLFSMAIGMEISETEAEKQTIGEIVSISVGEIVTGGIDVGGTSSLESKIETMQGFDYRYDFMDVSSITSSIDSNNKDFIGPGYGDRYWGEAWTLDWKMRAYHRTYWNGTDRYEEAKLTYNIIRGAEVFLPDAEAPEEWRNLNPVHNNWQNVTWIENNTQIYGNQLRTNSHEVTACNTLSTSVTITLGSEVYMKLPGFSETLTCDLRTQMYRETSISASYTIGYVINDDESTDCIVQDIGIDKNFGTYIFRTNSSLTKTSYPLEYNTFDYLPPIIDFPNIRLDSSQDGEGPCSDDSPMVTVDLFDEGGIRSALLFYSINYGSTWFTKVFSEQMANRGTWEASIPSYPRGTTVSWYIKVWDLEGSSSNRTDPYGNPYRYTVINRPPKVRLLNPTGGEAYQDVVNIEFSGSDPDGDSLTYSLAYNMDNTGWHLIASDLTDTSYNWSVSHLTSDNVLLKVIADDGDLRVEDIMDYVFVINPSEISGYLQIEITDQIFSKETFNISFYVCNELGYEIDFASFKMWWNGIEVSNDIQNLGEGEYFVSLNPITVLSGEDPILLNMTISASGFEDKYFEVELAVDPKLINKPKGKEGPPILNTVIIVGSVAGGVGISIALGWVLMKRRGIKSE